MYRRQCVGVVGVVLGVERPEERGVLADGRRGLAECVGVVTGVVGVVLAPDHPLDLQGMLVGRRAKLETALLMEAGFGGGVGLAGRGMLDLGVWEEEPEDGPSVWVCVEALGRTRRGTRGRWPGADSGLGSLVWSAAGGLGAAGCSVRVEPRGEEVFEYPLSDLPDHSSPSISRSNLMIPGGSRPHHPCARRPTSSRHSTTPRSPL